MNPTHSANQPQSFKECHVPVKKLHSSAKYRLSLNQPQSTTSERFLVKQPQISYKVRAGYLGISQRRIWVPVLYRCDIVTASSVATGSLRWTDFSGCRMTGWQPASLRVAQLPCYWRCWPLTQDGWIVGWLQKCVRLGSGIEIGSRIGIGSKNRIGYQNGVSFGIAIIGVWAQWC